MYCGNAAWHTQEFVHIAMMQNQMEDQLARLANRVLICDTNSFATMLWHERYVGCLSPYVEQMTTNYHYDLYLVTGDEIPFVQDGTRDGEHLRHRMHRRFIDTLQEHNEHFFVISGSPEKRLREAVSLVDEVLAVSPARNVAEGKNSSDQKQKGREQDEGVDA